MRMITREVVASLGANLTIDWTARKSAWPGGSGSGSGTRRRSRSC